MDGITKRLKSKQTRPFILNHSAHEIIKLLGYLPDEATVYKLISFSGGFASLSFIKAVADREPILELTASTLRIGEKQFEYLAGLNKSGRLKTARFFVGSIMKSDNRNEKYDYYSRFCQYCKDNGWKQILVNNHSKIILMRTARNWYVLETSSNLNENPKIEQYSFENSKELYCFYYDFFDKLEAAKSGVMTNGRGKATNRAD